MVIFFWIFATERTDRNFSGAILPLGLRCWSARSLRMIAACGFDKDRGQGPCDAELYRTFGAIVEWAVICLDCCLSQILDIRLAQTPETNGLARFFPCGRPFDKAGFFHPLGCEPQNIGFYFGWKQLSRIPISEHCPFFANPPVLLRTDTFRFFFIIVLSRFILFGIVIIFTRRFICAGLLAGRRARRVRGSIGVAYRINLHRVDFVFGVMAEFVFARDC